MKRFVMRMVGFSSLWVLMPVLLYAAGNPAAPILVLRGEGVYSSYIAEVLKAEGFNAFQEKSLSDPAIGTSYMKKFDVVILGEAFLVAEQADMLKKFVGGGGNLIALRPDSKLAVMLGLAYTGRTLENAYIEIDSSTEIGEGFLTDTLQFHAEADCYELDGAVMIAELFYDSSTNSGFPAVTFTTLGRGHVAAFTYDLMRSIIETRQGNWRVAGRERDGINGLRPMDMFADGWVDASKNGLNQADEQMRLFSRIVETMAAYKKPLPRFWYFPDAKMCYAVLTNDSEMNTGAEIDSQLAEIKGKGVGMTVYVLDTKDVTRAQTDRWVAQGHEIAAHPGFVDNKEQDSYATNPTWSKVDAALGEKIAEIEALYGQKTETLVNHWFVWCGKDSSGIGDSGAMAEIIRKHGVGLEGNFAQYDNNSPQGAFLGGRTNVGNYTGSGLPMKLSDHRGTVFDIYQLPNNVYDQEYMEANDPDGFFGCFKTIMDRSLNSGAYSWIHLKSHRAEWGFSRVPVLRMLDYANTNGIPVVTAKKCLDFMWMKDNARFTDIEWSRDRLSFTLESPRDAGVGLTFMVTVSHAGKTLKRVTADGKPADYTPRSVKGREYVLVTVHGGERHTIRAEYR